MIHCSFLLAFVACSDFSSRTLVVVGLVSPFLTPNHCRHCDHWRVQGASSSEWHQPLTDADCQMCQSRSPLLSLRSARASASQAAREGE